MTPAPRRRLARRALTAVSGAVLLAAAAGAALAGETWPVEEAAVPPAAVPVAPTTVAQVCPGPPRLATAVAGEDLGYDEFDPAGSGTRSALDVVVLGPDGDAPGAARLRALEEDAEEEDVARSGVARQEHVEDLAQAVVLEADPVDDALPLLTGTSVALTEAGDLRGLTATPCQTPTTSAWLVGGSTEPGDSAQLVLSNTGATPATVTLTGWSGTGPLDLSSAGSVLVPPGQQQVVLLEALAADPRVAVHVTAAGGEVTAVVQDSRLRGLVAGGTDLVVPSAAPAERVVVPGIALGSTSGEDVDAPTVRIVNPGSEPLTAGLELLGPDGVERVPGADELVVDPGAVVDVSLAGLPRGTWTAVVTGDAPLTAAAVSTTVGQAGETDPDTPPVDRAWAPATTGLSSGVVSVPVDLVDSASLVLANPADGAVDVELVPVLSDGTRATAVSRTVAAGTSLVEDVAGLAEGDVAAVELSAPGPVHAAVMLSVALPDGSGMSVVPFTEDPRTAAAVPVARPPASLG